MTVFRGKMYKRKIITVQADVAFMKKVQLLVQCAAQNYRQILRVI